MIGNWAPLRRGGGLGLLSLVTAGCSQPQPRPARPSLLEAQPVAEHYPSPAQWRHHPRELPVLLARWDLPSGKLYAGAQGERWLVGKEARSAADFAPESLVAILRGEAERWVFVGASGTAYEASTPLGSFERSNAPLEPLRSVCGAGETILGVRDDGSLARSGDHGVTWTTAGPRERRFVAVRLRQDGKGLALAVPEEVWQSPDFGSSWQKVSGPTFGASALAQDGRGEIFVEGVIGKKRWNPQDGVLGDYSGKVEEPHYTLAEPPPRGPDAGALTSGRACVVGTLYYELAPKGEKDQSWTLWVGTLDASLRSRPVDELAGCREVRVAGHDRWLEVACWRDRAADVAQKVRFYRSEDRGKTFKVEDFVPSGKRSELRLAVGREGQLLVTGICRASAPRTGCRPAGVHYRRTRPPDRGGLAKSARSRPVEGSATAGAEAAGRLLVELAPAATPALQGSARALAFSSDGTIAYAMGTRTKDDAPAIYVSTNGGHGFVGRDLGLLRASDEAEAWRASDQGSTDELRVAEDGAVSLVQRSQDRLTWVIMDGQGRVGAVARPPSEATMMGAIGTRALAVSMPTRATWESLDGGASWAPAGKLPVNLCPGDEDCEIPISCARSGCVLGDALSRVGWRARRDDGSALLPPPESATRGVVARQVRTPFSCTLAEQPWTALAGARGAPSASQAALGEVAWFVPTIDDARAAAGAYHAYGGPRQRIERVDLLHPVSDASDRAFHVSLQVEGTAALRYRVPKPGAEPTVRDVEVAWDNLVEGRVVRTRLAQGGVYRPGDVDVQKSSTQRANPALVSIASGGLYVRLHSASRDAQITYFLDGRGTEEIPEVPWPTVEDSEARTEMARVDGQHVPLLLVGEGAQFVWARRSEAQWEFSAFSTGLADPSRHGIAQTVDITYLGSRAGLAVMMDSVRSNWRDAWLYPFPAGAAPAAAPVAIPTQNHVGQRPEACKEQQRATSPRVVAPFRPGTRHLVTVADAVEPLRTLLTGDAVLHGTPQQPCVAAFDARLVQPKGTGEPQLESAIISLADLEHAWMFRLVPDPESRSPRVEQRPMTCRFDPTAEIPAEVYGEPGTEVLR